MFKRKITETLKEWKQTKNNEYLLIVGARQVGKTFIIRKFAKENYEKVIEINFLENKDLKKIFKGSLSAVDIYSKISLYKKNGSIIPHKTLLFLDEIQDCGQARTALKFLAQDNQIDVIASGSMLETSYKQTASIPVGYERKIEMFSMDFEEFMWARGFNEETLNITKPFFESNERIPDEINNKMMQYLREYIVVGGMPSVVKEFINSADYYKVHLAQKSILKSYYDDIAKYAPLVEKPKVRQCYLSIPQQLSKENKKFQYSVVEKRATSRKYEGSLEWLKDAGLIQFCNNVSTPSFPLSVYQQNDYFKVYTTDIGILIGMHEFELKKDILDNTLTGPAKGGIYESLIADFLIKKNKPLLYYKPKDNKQEIEFLLTKNSNIIPLEVKAGNNAAVSLNSFVLEFNPPYAYKLINGNAGINNKVRTLPLYMAMFL